MHPCLLVDDILRLVFQYIEDRTTLCALARTCRTFNEPASDLIWETLSNVKLIMQNLSCEWNSCEGRYPVTPYYKLLPSCGQVETHHQQYLTQSRLLSDNDWSIVRRIPSHVRRLHFHPFPIIGDIPPWFSFLTSPPDPSFFSPNLYSLTLGVPLDHRRASNTEDIHATFHMIARLFRLLLRPRLSTLRLGICGAFYPYLVLPSVPRLCPNIRMLSIEEPEILWGKRSIPDEVVYLFSGVVSELCDLEIVASDAMSWDLLSSLALAKAL